MRRLLREITLHALAVVSLGIAAQATLAAPTAEPHRAVITRTQPVYPELARRMHIVGTVILRVAILPDGTVSAAHVESGHALLRQAAQDAVQHWRFVADPSASVCIVAIAFEDR
jgi:TonB family protein